MKPTIPDSFAQIIIANGSVGSPYRPSNGTEGEIFACEWCQKCRYNYQNIDDGCKIINDTMLYSEDDPKYPKEWTYGDDGQPKCSAFSEVVK